MKFLDKLRSRVCQGRLTTESGVPVSASDRSAQSTLYFTPYQGNALALYTGSTWRLYTFSELSLALSGLTSGKNYDVFVYDNAGTLTLELSAAWTNDTTRADALALQDGVYCKSGALTRRYLGTIRTTGTTTTEDSKTKRFVWNYYNRMPRMLRAAESTNQWTYTTDTFRQANAGAGNQVEVVVGIAAESLVDITLVAAARNTSGTINFYSGIGVDSTSAASTDAHIARLEGAGTSNNLMEMVARLAAPVPLGYHYYAWLEKSAATGTTTWFGTSAGVMNFGLRGMINA